jgi:hypothetical protein
MVEKKKKEMGGRWLRIRTRRGSFDEENQRVRRTRD